MAGKAKKSPPEVWLGNRCKVCGAPIRGRRKVYCGENCRKAAHSKYCREYYHKNKQKSVSPNKTPGTALRIVPGNQRDNNGCVPAGQPSVSDAMTLSLSPFPEKQTRKPIGGISSNKSAIPMYCEKYRQIITAAVCAQRQDRRKGGAEFVDVFCRHTCRGAMLRPATEDDLSLHRNLIRQVSREKGLEVMSA